MIQNRAVTTYTATGRRMVVEETFFHHLHHPDGWLDPLAQTFSFVSDTLLTAIGIFFGQKGTLPVTVQIRDVVNGYPGPTVYDTLTLPAASISTSTDAQTETKFVFTDPFLCNRDTQYCWVLMTEDINYQIWIAKMGERDIKTGECVPAQPFLGGVLFSSSDNRAWTAHQDMDAKFKIYTAQFDSTDAILNFNQLTAIEAAELVLSVNQLIPSGTSIKWEVSQDGSTNWIPLSVNGETTKLPSKYANCYVRAVLSGNNMSPIINLGAVVATGIKFALSGKYVNRNIVTLSNFTKVDIWADVSAPSGSTTTFKFSTNDGSTWTTATQVGTQAIDSAFTQYHYQNTVAAVGQFRISIDYTGTEIVHIRIRKLMVTLS